MTNCGHYKPRVDGMKSGSWRGDEMMQGGVRVAVINNLTNDAM